MKEFELESGEYLVRETRKHWFLFATGLIPYVFLAVMPLLLPSFLALSPLLGVYGDQIHFTDPLMRAAYGIWLLFIWTGAWGSLTRYYLNAWILTNTRIVAIKQQRYFNREVSSVLLNRVQDVTSEVHGIVASLLGIGGITVQSAGAEKEFVMRGIPRPEEMRDLILKHVPEEASQNGV